MSPILNSIIFRLASVYLFFFIPFGVFSSLQAHARPILTILTYDSMLGAGSMGEWIEKNLDFKIKWIRVNDAGQLLARLKLEQKKELPSIHLVIGVDYLLLSHFKPLARSVLSGFFDQIAWLPKIKENVLSEPRFIPFDWGALGFLVDTEKIKNISELKKLSDLTLPGFHKKWVVQDPRSSTPGLQFLLASETAPWGQLSKSWYSLAPSWDASYGMFKRGQVPMVWTYLTSLAYELKRGGSDTRFQWVNLFSKHPIQLEGMILPVWVSENSATEKEVLRLMQSLLSVTSQTALVTRQWMFPVVNGVELPLEFQKLPPVFFDWPKTIDQAHIEAVLKRWRSALGS